ASTKSVPTATAPSLAAEAVRRLGASGTRAYASPASAANRAARPPKKSSRSRASRSPHAPKAPTTAAACARASCDIASGRQLADEPRAEVAPFGRHLGKDGGANVLDDMDTFRRLDGDDVVGRLRAVGEGGEDLPFAPLPARTGALAEVRV